jgi:hypothetical protein
MLTIMRKLRPALKNWEGFEAMNDLVIKPLTQAQALMNTMISDLILYSIFPLRLLIEVQVQNNQLRIEFTSSAQSFKLFQL